MKTNLLLLTLTLLALSQAEAQRLPASETVTNDNAIEKITEFINSGAYITNKPNPLTEEAKHSSGHLISSADPERQARMKMYQRWIANPNGPDTESKEAKPEATDSSK